MMCVEVKRNVNVHSCSVFSFLVRAPLLNRCGGVFFPGVAVFPFFCDVVWDNQKKNASVCDRRSKSISEDMLQYDGIVALCCWTHLFQDVCFVCLNSAFVFVRLRSIEQNEPRDARMTSF